MTELSVYRVQLLKVFSHCVRELLGDGEKVQRSSIRAGAGPDLFCIIVQLNCLNFKVSKSIGGVGRTVAFNSDELYLFFCRNVTYEY